MFRHLSLGLGVEFRVDVSISGEKWGWGVVLFAMVCYGLVPVDVDNLIYIMDVSSLARHTFRMLARGCTGVVCGDAIFGSEKSESRFPVKSPRAISALCGKTWCGMFQRKSDRSREAENTALH